MVIEKFVFVNGKGTIWYEEDITISRSGVDAIVLPKVEDPRFVVDTAELMDKNGAPEGMKICVC